MGLHGLGQVHHGLVIYKCSESNRYNFIARTTPHSVMRRHRQRGLSLDNVRLPPKRRSCLILRVEIDTAAEQIIDVQYSYEQM